MEQLTAVFLGEVTESVRQSRMDEGATHVQSGVAAILLFSG